MDRLKIDIIDERGHVYWSTWCRHEIHDACNATELAPGVPRSPAQCKHCAAPCVCDCHKEHASDDLEPQWRGAGVQICFAKGGVMMRSGSAADEILYMSMDAWIDFLDAVQRGDFDTPSGVDKL